VLSNYSIRTLGSLSTSDHNPVLLTIRGPLQADETKPNYIYRDADWKLFQTYLAGRLNTHCLDGNSSTMEVDVAVRHLTDTLNNAARYAIPRKCKTFSSMQIATSTRILIQKINKLRAQWHRTHDVTLRPLINSLKEQIDSAIKNHVSNSWQKTLQGLDSNNMNDTWRITKSLTKDFHITPPFTFNGKTANTTEEKLKTFADTLEHIFTTNPIVDHSFTVSTERVVNDFLQQPLTDRVRHTNHFEIAWIVRHLKPRKAAGPDGIQNIILQHLPRSVLKFIAKIFNTSLALNYFPASWKVAKIIMLPKPGKDHTSPLNYRPISLLNSLGKLFEKIILKRLTFQLRKLKVIRNEQ
jgi:hypothetical protein